PNPARSVHHHMLRPFPTRRSSDLEGISYIAGAELPCLIVNIVRGGPGLGSIQPAQSDYYQATRGGGHGDYRMPVFAPASVQEAVDRKSTRLNSSHVSISYAVFCLQ